MARRAHPAWELAEPTDDSSRASGGAPEADDRPTTRSRAVTASDVEDDARTDLLPSRPPQRPDGAGDLDGPGGDRVPRDDDDEYDDDEGDEDDRTDRAGAGDPHDGLIGFGADDGDDRPAAARRRTDSRAGDSRGRPGRPRGEEGFGTGRRRRRWGWIVAAGILVLALAGGLAVTRDLWGVLFPPDFEGPGTGSVVVQVADGDSIRTVGDELVARGVVASARTFGSVSEDDPRGRGVAPGFYLLKRQMSAQEALDALLDPASRLGRVEIRGGTQLDDTAGAGDAVVPGVLALIARATCAPGPVGTPICRSPEDIRRVMTSTDPTALGVPSWAAADVARAEPRRRLEGLIAPGTYDIPPGSTPEQALESVVRTSAERLSSTGIAERASSTGLSPYQVLVVASIVEKEGVEQDFPKIARVIENRLPIPMRLQMDSTINYPLDRQTLLTTPFDRATPGPYNTYLNLGLPPTPIASASTEAVSAALAPATGGWIYFVKCEDNGVSCFAVTPEEHDANRRLAQERGVY